MRVDGILSVLGLARRAKGDLEALLATLADQGSLLRLRGGLWARPENPQAYLGPLQFPARQGGLCHAHAPADENENNRDSRLEFTGARDVYIPAGKLARPGIRTLCAWRSAPALLAAPRPRGASLRSSNAASRKYPPTLLTARATRFCRPADARLSVNSVSS